MLTKRCIECGKRAEWLILGINLGLFILKALFVTLSNSKALLADAFESLANSIITVVVLISLTIAARKADENYPYGYGKVEFLSSAIVNVALMMAAISFILISFGELVMVGPERPPGFLAVVAAIISIVVNQVAFKYGQCVGEKLGSSAILANAMVSRADVATSVAVIVAVVGSNCGFAKIDHIVAIAIGVLIVRVTWVGSCKAVQRLMDVALPKEELCARKLAKGIEGVAEVGELKVRYIGRDLWIDLDAYIQDDWTLDRGLEIVRSIQKLLRQDMKDVVEVSVQLLPFESIRSEVGS